MHPGLKRLWIGFLISLMIFGILLSAKTAELKHEKELGLSRKQRSAIDENEHILMDDLKTLLELKQQIEIIKKDSTDPELDESYRLSKVEELKNALETVNSLKESVEKRMKNSDSNFDTKSQGVQFCNLELIETVPDVLIDKDFQDQMTEKSIFEAWISLLDTAMLEVDVMSQWAIDGVGRSGDIFGHMKKAIEKNVRMNVLFNSHANADMDTGFSPYDLMKSQKYLDQVHIGNPNISGLIHQDHTSNIIHTKMMITDEQNLYVGSGNLGSRCTTRTKEMGILATKCPALALDAKKIWKLYNYISVERKIPEIFPSEMETSHNLANPLKIFNHLDGFTYKVVIGSSPVALCPSGRSDDLALILSTIDEAQQYIHISVGEYVPMEIHGKTEHHWEVIDDHLKDAVIHRGVELKMLVNEHATHRYLMKKYLKRLSENIRDQKRHANIQLKYFSSKIDKHRFHGSHGKFMVTEKAGYIGTSNWTEDYFTDTAGGSVKFAPDLTANQVKSSKKSLIAKMEDIFQRDWDSDLSRHL